MTQPATETHTVLWDTRNVGTYAAYNQSNRTDVASEAVAHDFAATISAETGHATVHRAGSPDLLFSYMDGVLFTDNRPGRTVWHEAAPATAGRLTAI